MRKLLLIPLLFAAFTAAISAQDQNEENQAVLPPNVVLSSFERHYPEIQISSWRFEKGKYEASFESDYRKMICQIDSSGRLLETEMEITFAELPRSAQNVLNESQVLKVEKVMTIQGTVFYEAETAAQHYHFQANGKPFHPQHK